MGADCKEGGNELDRKIWYTCDPNKNTECSKSGCKSNENSVYPVCELTSKKEYSTDGIPMESVKDGEKYILKIMEE